MPSAEGHPDARRVVDVAESTMQQTLRQPEHSPHGANRLFFFFPVSSSPEPRSIRQDLGRDQDVVYNGLAQQGYMPCPTLCRSDDVSISVASLKSKSGGMSGTSAGVGGHPERQR